MQFLAQAVFRVVGKLHDEWKEIPYLPQNFGWDFDLKLNIKPKEYQVIRKRLKYFEALSNRVAYVQHIYVGWVVLSLLVLSAKKWLFAKKFYFTNFTEQPWD